MTIKSALTVVALAAGLVAGPALAQDRTIGTLTVAPADEAAVAAYCEELQSGVSDDTLSTSGQEEDDGVSDAPEGSSADDEQSGGIDSPGDSAAASLDLSTVTIEDCQAGGWLTAM